MITLKAVLLLICANGLAFLLWKLVPKLLDSFMSPFRHLPGPPAENWLHGHLKEVFRAGTLGVSIYEEWVEKYGNTFKYKGWFSVDALYTVDTKAIHHILTHPVDYQKPATDRFVLGLMVGKGLLVVEGEQHRKQRKILNPAFGLAQIREMTGIFVDKSIQLRDLWSAEIGQSGQAVRVNALAGLNKMTLDAIGVAGFNYDLGALSGTTETNELSAAFDVMFRAIQDMSLVGIIETIIPLSRFIPNSRMSVLVQSQQVMKKIGMQLIAERKAEISKAGDSLKGRDLLTLLLKANMATDIPEDERLSDEDVLAQVPTFLFAGHETTSTATTWCLFALTQAPAVQAKLRDELWSVPTEEPSMEQLNALPYLDAVVRETMRVHPPVPITVRVAMKDDVIPLGTPCTDVYGQMRDTLTLKKGHIVPIPILVLNRSKALWGQDAAEFKPERWESLPEAVHNIPGVWGNMLSFLGGPRACIGYRFSLIEMKALLFTLVREFEFALAVPPEDITIKISIVQRPLVQSELEKGTQMPLFIKPHKHVFG